MVLGFRLLEFGVDDLCLGVILGSRGYLRMSRIRFFWGLEGGRCAGESGGVLLSQYVDPILHPLIPSTTQSST